MNSPIDSKAFMSALQATVDRSVSIQDYTLPVMLAVANAIINRADRLHAGEIVVLVQIKGDLNIALVRSARTLYDLWPNLKS